MTDIHIKRAMELFGCTRDDVNAEHRDLAKFENYGSIYGGSMKALQKEPTPDVHTKRAMELFGYPEVHISPALRNIGKMDNYRRIYGRLLRRLSRPCLGGDKMPIKVAIHIVRNPYGHSEAEVRTARLAVCDELEWLEAKLAAYDKLAQLSWSLQPDDNNP